MVISATEAIEAKALFGELGVKTVNGHCFLEVEDVHTFGLEKVKTWTSGVGALAKAANSYPQAVLYSAVSKSLHFNGPTCKECYQIVNPALKSCAMH